MRIRGIRGHLHRIGAMAAVVLAVAATDIVAQVRMTREDALKTYFPGAVVERTTVFLSDAQAAEIRQRSRTNVESKVVTYYVARNAGRPAGAAFFETQTVRTMPATFVVVIDPDSTVRAVEVLAFHEPQDYAPSGRWLAQFAGRRSSDDLYLKRGIQNIAGSTLTSQALTDATRRLLATYEVVVAGGLAR